MKLIVLTHTHFDHAENAAKLSKHFGIPVACHEADVELFESFDKQPMESYGIVGDELDNWICPATGHLYNDLDAIRKSAGKIDGLGERTIYYGHGKPTGNRFKHF